MYSSDEGFMININVIFNLKKGSFGKLKLVSFLANQVKDLRLQDKLGQQIFHENLKKLI